MEFLELIEAINEALDDSGIAHAFGGALALGFAGSPRGTADVDVNVFLAPREISAVSDALAGLGFTPEFEDAAQIGGLRYSSPDSIFPIDVFPSLDANYDEVARRVKRHPFGRSNRKLPFLSAEDIAVFKLSFGRGKDWIDLEDIAAVTPGLDLEYIERQLVELRGPTMYRRFARFRRLFP